MKTAAALGGVQMYRLLVLVFLVVVVPGGHAFAQDASGIDPLDDLDVVGLQLAPSTSPTAAELARRPATWDLSAIAEELRRVDRLGPDGPAVEPPLSTAPLRSSVGLKTVELWPDDGRVAIRDFRDYDGHDGRTIGPDEAWQASEQLLQALSVQPAESDVRVRTLKSITQAINSSPDSSSDRADIAEKLFVALLGYPWVNVA